MKTPSEPLVEGTPPAQADVRVSIGVNLAMAMVLVDYALYGSRPVEPWVRALADALPAAGRLDLAAVHAVLVHGLVLRDAFIAEDDPPSWTALRERLCDWSSARWRGLIAVGCASSAAYSGDDLPEGWDGTEQGFLATVDAVAGEWTAGDRARLRRLAADPARFGETVIGLLDALWSSGVGDAWERDRFGIEAAAVEGRAAVDAARGLPFPALVARVANLLPPPDWSQGWEVATSVLFLPCTGMGSLMSSTRLGERAVVCYTPDLGRARRTEAATTISAATTVAAQQHNQQLAAALHSLAASVRAGVWAALRAQGEMYAGQLAEVLGAGQSAVSRWMVPLEESGLVNVRRVGPAKFYTINDAALERLTAALGSPPAPGSAGPTTVR